MITPGRTVEGKNENKNMLGNMTRRQMEGVSAFVSRWLSYRAPARKKDLHVPSELYQNHCRHVGGCTLTGPALDAPLGP